MRSKIVALLIVVGALGLRVADAQVLNAHLIVDADAGVWAYTAFNDEPIGSPNYITSFDLNVSAPISGITSPMGWDFQTDNLTFVSWFSTDLSLPYPHDITPGSSLSGFSIQSLGAHSDFLGSTLAAWDHNLDAPGTTISQSVLSPSTVPLATPEPGINIWSSVILIVALALSRRRHRQTDKILIVRESIVP